jgi:hypothetical protein
MMMSAWAAMAPRLKTARNKETNILIERQLEYFMAYLPFSSLKWKKRNIDAIGTIGVSAISC